MTAISGARRRTATAATPTPTSFSSTTISPSSAKACVTTKAASTDGASSSKAESRQPREADGARSDHGHSGWSYRNEHERDHPSRDSGEHGATVDELRGQERQKEGREGCVEAEPLGIAQYVSEEDAEGGAADPERKEHEPCAHENALIDAAVADLSDRPGLVDDQLRLHHSA